MKCSKCRNEALKDVKYAGLYYCKRHFQELMEKRVRRNLRTTKAINPKKEYSIFYEKTPEYNLNCLLLKKIFGAKLKLKRTNKISENTIISASLDDEADSFLNEFISNKKQKNKNTIKPLQVLMRKEIELLCKINKIPFKRRTGKGFLDKLENRYPGTKFSVYKSKEHMVKKTK